MTVTLMRLFNRDLIGVFNVLCVIRYLIVAIV